MTAFSNQIKQQREQKGLSQEEVARRAGINIRTLQRIEKGKTSPYGATLRAISEVLDLDMHSTSLSPEDRKLAVIFELSALTFWIFPFGNLIIPYLMYVILGQRLPGGTYAWQQVKRFQLPWTVVLWVLLAVLVFFMISNRADMMLAVVVIILGLVFLNTIIPITKAYRFHRAMTDPSIQS